MRFEDLVNRLEQEFSFFFNTDDMDSNLRDTFPQEENEEVVDVEVEDEEVSEEDLPF
jgi:gluconate kinase